VLVSADSRVVIRLISSEYAVVKPSTAHYPQQHLFVKKRIRKHPKETAHLHQRNQVFPISIMETLLNWVLLASL